MSETERLGRLLEQLRAATYAGRIHWRSLADPTSEIYHYSNSAGAVVLTRMAGLVPPSDSYRVEVLDQTGRAIESHELSSPAQVSVRLEPDSLVLWQMAKDLLEAAAAESQSRAQAVTDGILNHLDED